MPWQELTEKGAEAGTSFLLDCLFLNGAGRLARNLRDVLHANNPLTQQLATDIGAVAKVSAEDGFKAAQSVVDTIAKNPELIEESVAKTVERVAGEGKGALLIQYTLLAIPQRFFYHSA